jgi:trehalose/maltose hydrolase-like predicted phosphorylase
MLEENRETAGSNWTLAYDSFDPAEESLREALTSTGNGYFCTRGALGWSEADGVSYPGTYTHGGYNRETTIMAGVPVLNEDLVNLPNWLLLELRIEGEEALDMSNVELLSYRHEYDARYALLKRIATLRDRGVGKPRSRRAASSAWPTCTRRPWSGPSSPRTGRAT